MPASTAWKIGAVRSALIASTVPAARRPTVWLNLPLAPMLTYSRGRDRTPRDPDLARTREPPFVGDLSGRAELRAEERSQRLQVVVRIGCDAHADADDRVCFREHVEVVVSRAGENAYAIAGGERDRLGARSEVVVGARGDEGGQHAGAHGRHLDRRRAVDRGDELSAERRLPRDEPVVVALEVDRVARQSRAEVRGDARRDLAAPRGRAGEDRPRLRGDARAA